MTSPVYSCRTGNIYSDYERDNGHVKAYAIDGGFRFGLFDSNRFAEIDTDRESLILIRKIIDDVLGGTQ